MVPRAESSTRHGRPRALRPGAWMPGTRACLGLHPGPGMRGDSLRYITLRLLLALPLSDRRFAAFLLFVSRAAAAVPSTT